MRADQEAQFAVGRCTAKADTSGQVFGVIRDKLVLFSQPGPVRSLARIEGWSPESLIEQALPSMKASYSDMGASASVFPYEPI